MLLFFFLVGEGKYYLSAVNALPWIAKQDVVLYYLYKAMASRITSAMDAEVISWLASSSGIR